MTSVQSSSYLLWLVESVCLLKLNWGVGGVDINFSLLGLNITACNTVILLEPWWNPSAEVSHTLAIPLLLFYRLQEQAISRSYRIGQNLPVHVFRLVVKDSIEESIEKVSWFLNLSSSPLSHHFGRLKISNAKWWKTCTANARPSISVHLKSGWRGRRVRKEHDKGARQFHLGLIFETKLVTQTALNNESVH